MYTIRLRRDSAARWERLDPVLSQGEPGFETNTGRMKIGDGVTPWSQLEYFSPIETADTESLIAHVNAQAPHPVYDDGPSLVLLYQNAKV